MTNLCFLFVCFLLKMTEFQLTAITSIRRCIHCADSKDITLTKTLFQLVKQTYIKLTKQQTFCLLKTHTFIISTRHFNAWGVHTSVYCRTLKKKTPNSWFLNVAMVIILNYWTIFEHFHCNNENVNISNVTWSDPWRPNQQISKLRSRQK